MHHNDDPNTGTSPPDAMAGPKGLHEAAKKYPNLSKVLNLELPVIAVLAEKTCSLEEVLSLREGSVIFFKKRDVEPLDVLIHNRKIGEGKAIKVGERFGIHLREVGSPEELLEKVR